MAHVASGLAPAAVRPGAAHDHVVVGRIIGLHLFIDLPAAERVLLIPEAGHMQRRHGRAAQPVGPVLALPEAVVIRVLDHLRQLRHAALEVALVEVLDRSELQEPFVAVIGAGFEALALLVVLERVEPVGRIGEPHRAVAMQVVVDPPVVPRRLGADGLERRMRTRERDGGRITGVGHAHHADPPVVRRHVLHQPVDRVIGVGRLVHALCPLRLERHRHGERAFAFEAAAHVLVDEDVAVRLHELEAALPADRAGRRHAIGRALEQDRQRTLLVERPADHRLQTGAVAHRHHHLAVAVARLGSGRCRLLRPGARQRSRAGTRQQQCHSRQRPSQHHRSFPFTPA